MPTNRTTVLLIVLGLVVTAAAIYMLFFRESSEPTLSSDTGAISSSEFTFINLAARIEPIVFDTSVLEDPRFMRLTDLRTTILPEDIGKQDPFGAR